MFPSDFDGPADRYGWHRNYRKHPKVTSDLEPPEWFLRELAEINPELRVEWWNKPYNEHRQGCEFRLIRVMGDGRWCPVFWFQRADWSVLRFLRQNDRHRDDVDWTRGNLDAHRKMKDKIRAPIEAKAKADSERITSKLEVMTDETIVAAESDRGTLYSIPR